MTKSATEMPTRTVVVVAPSGDRVERASLLAWEEASKGRAVLLVGPGVTLHQAVDPPGLRRRELGSYRTRSTLEATRELRESFHGWLDMVFAGAFGGYRPRDVLSGSAQSRFFDVERLDQLALFEQLFMVHAGDEVRVAEPDSWERALSSALRSNDRSARSDTTLARRLASRPRFVLLAMAGLGATITSILRDEMRGGAARRASFTELSRRRLWVVLTPDWARLNRHVIEAFQAGVVPASDLGVVVLPPLEPVLRLEPSLTRHPSAEHWSGLGELGAALDANAFALSTWGVSPSAFASGLWSSAVASARAVWNLVRSSQDMPLGRLSLPLEEIGGSLARLCTIDVWRARRTLDAAAELVRRTDFKGTTVLFAASNSAESAPLHLILRDAGAMTVDYFHGWTMEAMPIVSESPATLRLVWSNTDAARVVAGQDVAVLVREHGARPQQRLPRVARRLLLLTNYAHRDLSAREQPYRMLLQREILDGAVELRRRREYLELRWRPHPADLRPLIDGDARNRRLELLPTSLAEDLAWADLAVCSVSTTILSSLRSGLPTFVHVPPESRLAMSWVPAERSFFTSAELVRGVERYLDLAADSSEVANRPEQEMWDAHFGGPLVTTLTQLLDADPRGRPVT